MNLSSLGSLATNALDTARSTFKGLADAAIDAGTSPSAAETKTADHKTAQHKAAQHKAAQHKAAQHKAAQQEAAQSKAAETKRAETKAAEVRAASKTDGTADTAENKVKGRFGSVLDAYA